MPFALGSNPARLFLGDSEVQAAFVGSVLVIDDEPEPGDFARTASTNATMSIHSGHSLTDAYTYGNGWPGDLVQLRNSLMDPDDNGDTYIVRSTIPGSPMSWRWDNPTDIDAREDIGNFDTLMITEGGPPPRTTSEGMVNTLDYFCRFTANTIENGASQEVILWSIWPALNGPGTDAQNPTPTGDWAGFTFRTGLDEYWRSFKMMADYTTWKMHQLYDLPEVWSVWLIPGDRWMARVYDDVQLGLVPGIEDIADLFADDIHPDDQAAYGLSCFTFTSMYQVDLREQTGVYVPDGMATALRDYFWQIAWELAAEYEPVGMGGTEGASLIWEPGVDEDPMPNWTLANPNTGGGGGDPDPDPEPGEMPEFVFTASADDTSDLLAMVGTQPVIEDGVLKFAGGEALTSAMTLTDRYVVLSVMIPDELPTGVVSALVGFRASDTPGWFLAGPVNFNYNGYVGTFGAHSGGEEFTFKELIYADEWSVIEMWTDGESVLGALNSGEPMSALTDTPETIDIRLFPEGPISAHVAAIGICDYVPTPEGRAAARAWAQGSVPE